MTGTFAEQEIIDGYLDGLHDERSELPAQSNRSEAYIFGWRNGRDDRDRKPRSSASVLGAQAELILESTPQ